MTPTADHELAPAVGIVQVDRHAEHFDEEWPIRREKYWPTGTSYIERWLTNAITEERPPHFRNFTYQHQPAIFLSFGVASRTTDTIWSRLQTEGENESAAVALMPPLEKFSLTFNISRVKEGKMLPVTDENFE